MKKIFLLLGIFFSLIGSAQPKTGRQDEQQIVQVLNTQTNAWNNGKLQEFMAGYWNNDSLMFIGKSGINWGWQKTLENYQHAYPDTAAMGKLSFDIIVVKRISSEYYYVVGKWLLTRTAGPLSGHFDLLFKKTGGRWLIIADHSS